MTSERMGIGIIGCGNVSAMYNSAGRRFEDLAIVACADVDLERARVLAAATGGRACSVHDLLADPAVVIAVNLTIPRAHAEIDVEVLEAGKHLYSEKPLAITLADAQRVLRLARHGNLRVGCAPDTILGGGIQTCRKLLDVGAIGEPVAATAFMTTHGPESWHPDPAFFFQAGGGPLFDMGPYYLSALVTLLGPVRRVSGSTRITFPERTITSEPRRGTVIPVEVPTHVAGLLDFAGGPVATLMMSFDIWATSLPHIEIYGTEGTLSVPDPNTFGGPVRVRGAGEDSWRDVPLTHPYTTNSRGIGVADMAKALRSGRPHRVSGDLAYHVLEVMHAVHASSIEGRHIQIESTCSRPEALPLGLAEGTLDP